MLKKLKELYLLTDYKPQHKSAASSGPQKQWSTEEEAQLRELYSEFREAPGESHVHTVSHTKYRHIQILWVASCPG